MPGDRDLSLVVDEEMLEETERFQLELQHEIDVASKLDAMFRSSGWKEVAADLSAQLTAANQALISDSLNSIEAVANVRGQMRAFEWLLTMPERNRAKREMAKLRLNELKQAVIE